MGVKLLKGRARRGSAKMHVLVEKEASKEEDLLYQMQEK